MPDRLIDIAEEFARIEQLMEDAAIADGSGEEDREAVAEYVGQLFTAADAKLDDKADGIAAVLRDMQLRERAIKDEAAGLSSKARTLANRQAWLKGYVLQQLQRIGADKAGRVRTLAITANGGKPPLEITGDVPAEFTVQPPPKPDQELIRNALDSGASLPFAHYGDRGVHLRIR